MGLKDFQLVQLEILNEMNRICKENNLKFYLIGGTAIGAVRHNGFIPWDDDIDVGMFREDYDRFIKVCNTQLGSEYFIQTTNSDPEYPMLFTKLRKNGTSFVEPGTKHLKKIHQGIFIDIFPLDNISSNYILSRLHFGIMHFLISVASTHGGNYPKSRIKKIIKYIYSRVTIKIFGKKRLDRFAKKVAKLNKDNNSEYVINFFGRHRFKEMTKRSYFGEGKEMKFEKNEYIVPLKYDKYLTKIYGNYMKIPTVEDRETHEPLFVSTTESYDVFLKNKGGN